MTNQEFLEIRSNFRTGDEVMIRYYTYNKNDYIDVIGKVWNMFGHSRYDGTYCFSFTYIGTYKYHDNFNGKNFPKLNSISFGPNAIYCEMRSNEVIFIKSASIRAFKIHQLKNRKG